MNVLPLFEGVFSNREKAVAVWLLVFCVWALWKNGIRIRRSVFNVARSLFQIKSLTILLAGLLYGGCIILVLWRVGVWNALSIKDTIFWFFGTGLILIFSADDAAQGGRLFWRKVAKSFKFVVVFEFLVSHYTFALWIELILVPIVALFVGMGAVAEVKSEFNSVRKIIDFVLTMFGIFLITYVIFMLARNYEETVTFQNLRSFVLPPLLTLAFIPFLYFLALAMAYEMLFLRLGFTMKSENQLSALIKRKILYLCHLNLRKVNRFSKMGMSELATSSSESDILNLIRKFRGKPLPTF
jgi:hypothetical protein